MDIDLIKYVDLWNTIAYTCSIYNLDPIMINGIIVSASRSAENVFIDLEHHIDKQYAHIISCFNSHKIKVCNPITLDILIGDSIRYVNDVHTFIQSVCHLYRQIRMKRESVTFIDDTFQLSTRISCMINRLCARSYSILAYIRKFNNPLRLFDTTLRTCIDESFKDLKFLNSSYLQIPSSLFLKMHQQYTVNSIYKLTCIRGDLDIISMCLSTDKSTIISNHLRTYIINLFNEH